MAAESCLEAALRYAARGWRVLPTRADGKTPLTASGVKDSTFSMVLLQSWWNRWPGANIAIATGAASGIVVLDVDGSEGEGIPLFLSSDLHGPDPCARRLGFPHTRD